MKKNRIRKPLALLLALCLLLGGVAALAEETVVPTEVVEPTEAAAPVAQADEDDAVAVSDIPAPVETTVTVTPGEAAGQVDVAITDISSTGANCGLEIAAEAKTDDNGKVVSEKDTLEINDSDKLLTDEQKKLIEGANELNVEAGVIAENLSQPVEIRTPAVDEDGKPVLDENGQQIVNVAYKDSVTALEIKTDDDAAKETITVSTADLYARTTAAAKGDEESYAEGFNVYNEGKENTVNLNVDGVIYTDVERPETKDNETAATAWGPYASTSNGSASNVIMDDVLTAASAEGKNAEVYAYGVTTYTSGKGSASDAIMDDVDTSASAIDEKGEAGARGVKASASNEAKASIYVDNVTATATATEMATATGVAVSATANAAVDATVINAVTASAMVSDAEGIAVDTSDKDVDASAIAIDASAENATASVDVYGDVTAVSNGDATAVCASSFASETVWDFTADKSVENTAPGKLDVDVVGDVRAEGDQRVVAIDLVAETGMKNNEETDTSEKGKLGGTTDVTVTGDVIAQGAENHGSADVIIGANVYAQTNATVNLAVTGDVTATGKDAVGLDVTTEKGATANVLIDGTVRGDGVAIAVQKSDKQVEVNTKGEVTNKDEKPVEYDPTAANICVWAAAENAEGRIATVYDAINTRTEKEVTKTREDGTTYVDTEYTYETQRVVDEAASAKLEQAIWYIVGVNSKWQKRVTATGTGTCTVNDTTYQVAHQDDSVTLAIKLSKGKKLRKIMYNDGTEAEYVKNADGTYTVKMMRGGAMELSLKVKNKYQPAATADSAAAEAATADDKAVNGVKASDRLELVEAMKAIGADIDGNGAAVTVPGAAKLLSGDELEAFDKLNAKDRLLVTLCAMGFADEVKAETDGLTEDGKALADAVAERVAGLSDADKKAHEDAVAEQFPKGSETVDGAKRDTFRFDMTVEKDGKAENESYTFFDDNGTWKLCGVEAK